MYKHHYINHNQQTNGDHEVHDSECSYLPDVSNRTYLGYLSSSHEAINIAKIKFPSWSINGCYWCCPESHTSQNMQIFTIEMFIDALIQSREVTSLLVGSLLSTAWTEVISFFPSFIGAILAGDWTGVIVRLLILASCMMVIYRLVRKMPFMVLKSVVDMN